MTWVLSLGQEDPLEKGMAIHSSIIAWRIPWTEEPRGLQSDTTEELTHIHTKWYSFVIWSILIAPWNDSFELWFWRTSLRAPWTARRSNQSILKEISPEYSLEGLMLKLKLQYFGHLWLIWKDPNAGKDWRWKENRTTEGEMVGWHHWLNAHESENLLCTGRPGVQQSIGLQRVGHDWVTELNWMSSYYGETLCYPGDFLQKWMTYFINDTKLQFLF